MTIYIDGKTVEAREGQTILSAASEAGVRIPTLCFLRDTASGGSCGICEVEVGGAPLRACASRVKDGMEIRTTSPELAARRKSRLEQLAEAHRFDCELCPRCSDCEFIRLLNENGIYDFEYCRRDNKSSKESLLNGIILDASRCLGCRRCVSACPEKAVSVQASRAVVQKDKCSGCGQCVAACPTAALTVDETDKLHVIRQALHGRSKLCAAIVTPDAAAVFGELLFEPAGLDSSGKLAAILRRLGFGRVYRADGKNTVAGITRALHDSEESVTVVSVSTAISPVEPGADVALTICGLLTLYRRACVSRTTMVKFWRGVLPEDFDRLAGPVGDAAAEYSFGGAMPHRDCYSRNLSDLAALRAAALRSICAAE